MNELIPRDTVKRIVERRNRALDAYIEAHTAMEIAEEKLKLAREAANQSSIPSINRYNVFSDRERKEFINSIDVKPRADYINQARRLIDIDAWSHIIEITNLENLMDKKAKDEFQSQLIKDPPEVTIENVQATLEHFACDAGTIFKRGIAECFSKLDRRFRSHDGWKIGSRIILTRTFNDYGSWNYHTNERDTLIDVERVFCVLDRNEVPKGWTSGVCGAVDETRKGVCGARQTELDTEYFKIRIFKNGNAHLWFKRDDLVDKVNQLIGEYYGNPIPEDRAPEEDTGLNMPKTALAKNLGFYPTPDETADRLIEEACRYWKWEKDGKPMTVLEPSAGLGVLALKAVEKGAVVDCVEIHGDRAEVLRRTGKFRRVTQCDFLAVLPDPSYDLICMNPPFDRGRSVDHVIHALKFLKKGGKLASIMQASDEFRETKKDIAFRKMIEPMRPKWRDLPAGSFAESGTNVNTVILTLTKA